MPQQTLFGTTSERFLDIIPTSVIDIERSGTVRRKERGVDFDKESALSIYSEFHPEICHLVYSLFLRHASCVFDPFAGWGERHKYAKIYKKKYIGFDLNPEAIAYAKETHNVSNELHDSLTDSPSDPYDSVFTCPPYWNRELYLADSRGGDQKKTWEEFLSWYQNLWIKCIREAKKGSVICVVVGNWRKKKVYYDLVYQTQKIFDGISLEPVDTVIVSRKNITKIKVMIPQAISEGYTVNLHEILLVYRKS